VKLYTMTTAQLEVELEARQTVAEDASETEADNAWARVSRVEAQLETRDSWDHADPRVRESVGNYRP
jgi:hypothetical protein